MPAVLRIITRLNRGGPLRQLCGLVPALEGLGWAGPVLAGVVEPTEPDGTAALAATGAEIVPLPSLRRGIDPARDGRALREIVRHVRRVRPEVIHTHMGKAGAIGRAAGRLAGVPVVHTLHGHHFDAAGVFGKGIRVTERLLGRIGTMLVCLSERQRHDVVERHRVVPADRVAVIEPGFDVTAFRAGAGDAQPRGDDPFRAIWTGRLVDVKRPQALVDVMAAAPADIVLDVYGDGPLRDAVRHAVEAKRLGARITLHPAVDDVAPLVARADAFLLTSRSEGIPLSMLEAMVLGVPVVVPAVGGIPDVIADGETGRLAPAGDDGALAAALGALAADRAAARALGARGRAMAEARFDAGRLAAETAALYDRLRVRR